MGDPVVDILIDPLAIEDFDDVFDLAPVTEVEALDAERVTSAEEPVTTFLQPMPMSVDSIPAEKAAQLMGTSINAIKKRLRKGTLRGSKVEAKHGEKWFVDRSELDKYSAPVTEVEALDAERVTGAEEPVTTFLQPMPTSTDTPSFGLVNRIQELEQKLEGATYRNGYLEAENDGLKALLGAKDSQIKLLTDSQHKQGWWHRFGAWFIGSNKNNK